VFLFLGYAAICQIITLIYPGKQPMFHYICLGKMERNLVGVEVKRITTINNTLYVTVILHLFGFMLIQYNKRKNLFNNSTAVVKSFRLQNMDKQSLFRYVYFYLNLQTDCDDSCLIKIVKIFYLSILNGYLQLETWQILRITYSSPYPLSPSTDNMV